MVPIALYQYSYLPISETFIYRQLQGIGKRFDIRLFSLTSENLNLFPGFSPSLIPGKSILERISPRHVSTTFTPSRKRFIASLLEGVRLLYVNFGHMALSMQDVAQEAGVPLVVFFHGVDASALLNDKNYVGEYAKSTFHTVFANSENMRARLRPFLPDQTPIKVVRYGVDLAAFPFTLRKSLPHRGTKFLQVSRLDHKKGIDISLTVFARYINEVDSSARFVIAGEGPLGDRLAEQTARLGIAGSVTFLGRVDQRRVLELLQQADIFLQHSVTAPDGDMEGVPNVLIEAMASGLPVVSTYHSGIPELVTSGVDGFLVKERDEEGYFEALRSLFTSDVGVISRNARRTIEDRFNSEQNNSELTDYLAAISKTSS